MSTFTSVLKGEIARLARREAKTVMAGVQRRGAKMRRLVAALRRQVRGLERQVGQVARECAARVAAAPAPASEPVEPMRVTSRNVRALRRRLRLSQSALARALGVSSQSVYMWERRGGSLRLRHATRQAFGALQRMDRRQAQAHLAAKASGRKRSVRRSRGGKRGRRR